MLREYLKLQQLADAREGEKKGRGLSKQRSRSLREAGKEHLPSCDGAEAGGKAKGWGGPQCQMPQREGTSGLRSQNVLWEFTN